LLALAHGVGQQEVPAPITPLACLLACLLAHGVGQQEVPAPITPLACLLACLLACTRGRAAGSTCAAHPSGAGQQEVPAPHTPLVQGSRKYLRASTRLIDASRRTCASSIIFRGTGVKVKQACFSYCCRKTDEFDIFCQKNMMHWSVCTLSTLNVVPLAPPGAAASSGTLRAP